MTSCRSARETTTIPLPDGRMFNYRGDPDGPINQRSLRTIARDGTAGLWRKGTDEEWAAIGREIRCQPLRQMEFRREDFPKAEALARRLGYQQTAYTSTSALWGLFCLPDNPAVRHRLSHHFDERAKYPPYTGGCIIKTRELGLLFVQTHEDITREA